ncbi:uncharacterized [Tachysurus ichikawai]
MTSSFQSKCENAIDSSQQDKKIQKVKKKLLGEAKVPCLAFQPGDGKGCRRGGGKQAQIESDDVEAAGRRRVSVEQRLYLNLVLAKSLGRNSSAVSSGSAGCGRPVVSSLGISEKFPTRLEINAAHLLSGGD